jgi:hypothetical protein
MSTDKNTIDRLIEQALKALEANHWVTDVHLEDELGHKVHLTRQITPIGFGLPPTFQQERH